MTIRASLIWVFVLLILLLAMQAALRLRVVSDLDELALAEDSRLNSLALAAELRQSSDNLTNMARTYVATGDAKYESHFQEILSIRNGDAPRPAGYGGIYWDFVVAGQRPAGVGQKVSLEKRMRAAGFTTEEFALLNEAKSKSDALVQMENEAFHAMKGLAADGTTALPGGKPDPQRAQALMYGTDYHRAKAEIMRPIQKFLDSIDSRTRGLVADLRAEMQMYSRIGTVLALMLFGLGLVSFIVMHRKVSRPVHALSLRMRDIAEGERDLTQRVDARSKDEIGDLGRAFNTFIQKIQDTMTDVSRAHRLVGQATAEVAASTTQQEATANALREVSSDVAAAVAEISATSQHLSDTMETIAKSAERSASGAAASRQGLQGMRGSMASLLSATELVAQHLQAINIRTDSISGVVATITKVASQTNLLSVNAAIEAEKAGEQGRGFLVVAGEIRRLADRTSSATLEIGGSMKEMQSAVTGGVMEMEKFAHQVRSSVSDVEQISTQISQVIEEVEELTARFSEVNQGMTQQSEGAAQIQKSMETLRASGEETREVVQDLGRMASRLRQSVESVGARVAEFRLVR